MTAILRRELTAYFSSPIGYIYLFVFYVFSGFYFTLGSLLSSSADLSFLFGFLNTLVMFLIPILTMRLLSEDNKNKTDQALLTAPVSLGGLVFGKFLAAFVVYLLGLAVTLVYAMIIAVWTAPNWASVFANFLALAIFGGALIAIGMFISSLTENQVIAAVGGFAVALGLMLLDGFIASVQNPLLVAILSGLSFFSRYSDFVTGIFNFSSILFFVSVSFLFIFFTIRVLEKRRWA